MGFEHTIQISNYPETWIQQNVRDDLQAKMKSTDNSFPITEINASTAIPNFFGKESETAVPDSIVVETERRWKKLGIDRRTSTGTYTSMVNIKK